MNADYFEGIAAEVEDETEMWREATASMERGAHELEWLTLRRQILAYGGIRPTADYDWMDIPGRLCRENGRPADLVAAEAVKGAPWGDTGDDAAMMAYLWRAWRAWQAAKQRLAA